MRHKPGCSSGDFGPCTCGVQDDPSSIDERADHVARVIAAAIYAPQPHMSGSIWRAVTLKQRRMAEDAALAAIEVIETYAASSEHGKTP